MKNVISINPKRIATLRARRGLSQKELAGKIQADPGTVSRWERGKNHKVRPDVFGRLLRTLNATEDDLCGVGPLPEAPPTQHQPQREQMNLSIDLACRNALHLVARRYGVTRQQIVEIAPLLFFIFAEQSLQQRRKRLSLFEEAADAVSVAKPQHLPPKTPVDEAAVAEEKESIEARDLFADKVSGRGGPDWNRDLDNPFATFLREALNGVLQSAKPFWWGSWGSPGYQICVDEAAALVGGDADATQAILSGMVALHEMAKALPNGSPTETAEWARAEAERNSIASLKDLAKLVGAKPTQPEGTPLLKPADGAKS